MVINIFDFEQKWGAKKLIKVFLVEDEIVVREGIKNGINWKENGFEFVGEAGDGELAYPMIQNTKPDIIITDIKMPFMDGLELSNLIKSEIPNIKIVILSGYDEFQYAQRAITIGVTDYLLKPISGNQLIKAIIPIRDLILKERKKQEYYEKFVQEIKENEQIKQYKFFQELVSTKQPYSYLVETGKELGYHLIAQAYRIILLKVFAGEMDTDEYSEKKIKTEDAIGNIANLNTGILFFNRMTEGIAFLCLGNDKEAIEDKTKCCIKEVVSIVEKQKDFTYFMGVGTTVYRLSELNKTYDEAGKAFAYRYFLTKNQVVFSENLKGYQIFNEEDIDFRFVDPSKLNKRIIQDFLRNGMENETHHFIQEYFNNLGTQNVSSLLFRQYIVMDIYFAVKVFMEQINILAEPANDILGGLKKAQTIILDLQETKSYLENIINIALKHRIISSEKKYHIMIENARDYIHKHYNNDQISLNTVAASVNISPSHFSTIFSQEMGLTFVEYLTDVRMEKAKELLCCTNMRISEIGYEVGYKDSHYFSFLFKKVQGISPKDFRVRAIK